MNSEAIPDRDLPVRQILEGGRPDGPLPHHNAFNPDFTDRWRREKGLPEDAQPEDCYHPAIAIILGDERFFPSQAGLIRDEGDSSIVDDGWGRTVRIGNRNACFSEQLDSVLKEPGDLDRLMFEPPDEPSRFATLPAQLEQARRRRQCCFAKIGGLYCRSHFLRGEEQLLMDMALDEGFCHALFDRVADYFLTTALELLKRTGLYETGLWIFDDMASSRGPMFSPAMYEKYFLPRYIRIIAALKAAGCRRVLMHSDGNLLPVFELLLAAGYDGFNPIEPRCGMDAVQLRDRYGKIYIGGFCNTRVLPGGDPREIREHVLPLLAAAREGGIVPGFASAGADISPAAYDFYHALVRDFK